MPVMYPSNSENGSLLSFIASMHLLHKDHKCWEKISKVDKNVVNTES